MTRDKEELINILIHKYHHTLELLRGIEYYKNEYDFQTGRGGCLNYGNPYKDDFPEETRKKVSDFIYEMQKSSKLELLGKIEQLERKMVAIIFAISYGIDLINFIIKVKIFKWFM